MKGPAAHYRSMECLEGISVPANRKVISTRVLTGK